MNASGRFTKGFPVSSGPYIGDIDDYFLVDIGAGFAFQDQLEGLRQQAALFDRLRLSLYANDQGLVIDRTMELRD